MYAYIFFPHQEQDIYKKYRHRRLLKVTEDLGMRSVLQVLAKY